MVLDHGRQNIKWDKAECINMDGVFSLAAGVAFVNLEKMMAHIK